MLVRGKHSKKNFPKQPGRLVGQVLMCFPEQLWNLTQNCLNRSLDLKYGSDNMESCTRILTRLLIRTFSESSKRGTFYVEYFPCLDILVYGNIEQDATLLHIWCALRVDISEVYFECVWIIKEKTLNKIKV